MADNRHQIDDERNAAGLRILEMTDAVGFDAYAAGWIHDRPTGKWRYLLSTPMLKTEGPIWIYKRLMKLFKYTPLPEGVSPLDVFVIDPDHELSIFGNSFFSGFLSPEGKPKTRIPISTIAFDLRFDEFSVTDGFVSFYRRLPPSDRRRKRNPARTFNHKVEQLKAA